MENHYYPWGGDFTSCDKNSCVAVVLLTTDYTPKKNVAIFGHLKTENIGIEKIVANVISNPNIRYLVICGDEIKGHRSGSSLIALNKNGINDQNRIIDAPGAIPYIENLNKEAVERFRKQIEIIDLIGVNDKNKIDKTIEECINKSPPSFGKPYIAIKIVPKIKILVDDKKALHSKIIINY
ncbi:MAG: tetrahydromethanopterin S-methyltransferase subunit A, partial [Candidatus Thermoplasmatota archaeon]|nr:tetrahydromethanopterin S-methyltransferase subunit A [Candidatus Thermoplasmatota archaeon]